MATSPSAQGSPDSRQSGRFVRPIGPVGLGDSTDRTQEIPRPEIPRSVRIVSQDRQRHRHEDREADPLPDHDPQILGPEVSQRHMPEGRAGAHKVGAFHRSIAPVVALDLGERQRGAAIVLGHLSNDRWPETAAQISPDDEGEVVVHDNRGVIAEPRIATGLTISRGPHGRPRQPRSGEVVVDPPAGVIAE